MDIPREPARRGRKRLLYGGLALLAVVVATVGLRDLKPAAPKVDRAAVWIDSVVRGPLVIEVRGPAPHGGGGVSRGAGRWELRSSSFRQDGLPHQLLVLSDLSRVLRAEERSAWQRIVRVLGHEINNSLAPIKSIAGSLGSLTRREQRPADWEEDLRSGLQVIESRSESLGRFMGAYARLARLPRPTVGPVKVAEWVHRVAALETRLELRVLEGPPVVVTADGDQLDQLLINLVHNAVEAALEMGGGVQVAWTSRAGVVEVVVEDEGPGLPDPGNLFVPFFTTKASGSGIGLVLSRQIAEAHGGALVLEPRQDTRGARARLRLPLGPLMVNAEG